METTNLQKQLKEYGKGYTERLKRQLLVEKLNASGELNKSIDYNVEDNTLYINSKVVNGYNLLDLLDKGTDAAKKSGGGAEEMNNRIVRWMKAKGIRPRLYKTRNGIRNSYFAPSTDKNYKRAAKNIAYGIRKRGIIKRYGYKGSNIVQETHEAHLNKHLDNFSDAFIKDIVIELNKHI